MKSRINFLIIACIIIVLLQSGCNSTKQKNESVNNPTPITNETITVPTITPSKIPVEEKEDERVEEISENTQKETINVKAIYLTSWSAGNNLDYFIDLINKTELNAVVIDIREGDGKICYKTDIDIFKNNNGYRTDYDVEKVINKLHENNIYIIGRLVCFKDNFLPRQIPELAIKKSNGNPLLIQEPNGTKTTWMNPTNPTAWEYLSQIALEAVAYGFDEIQFDYVRFPETTIFNYDIEEVEQRERHLYIEEFIEHIRNKLPKTTLSADIFGVPCIFKEDLGDIGQVLESIGENLDYVSPMVYPSHYCNYYDGIIYSNILNIFNNNEYTIKGEKIKTPDKAPYEIVYNSLVIAKERIESVEGYNLKVRPYLQGFTLTYLPEETRLNYGEKEYKMQIKAVYDSGFDEWIFWNATNQYPIDAFLE